MTRAIYGVRHKRGRQPRPAVHRAHGCGSQRRCRAERKNVNITRPPWGAARSKVVAYVRGAYLISNHHNGQRLAAFKRTVLASAIQQTSEAMAKGEGGAFRKVTAATADESKSGEFRAAELGKSMRSRKKLESFEMLRTQPLQAPRGSSKIRRGVTDRKASPDAHGFFVGHARKSQPRPEYN